MGKHVKSASAPKNHCKKKVLIITAKEYLQQIRCIDIKINAKLEEIANLRDMITRITPVLSDTNGFGSGNDDKLGSAVAKIVDLESEVNDYIDFFVDQRKKIIRILDDVSDPDQFRVLYFRYCEFKTFEEIACEMNMTYRNVCYLHGKGLASVEKIMMNDRTD